MAMNGQVFAARQEAVREGMRREGLSAIVVFANSSYVMTNTSSGYQRYLTGFTGRTGPSMLVLPADGPATLMVQSFFSLGHVKELYPWIERSVCARGVFGSSARKLLLEMGCERAGIVGVTDIPHSTYQDLVGDGTQVSFSNAEHLIDQLRATKDQGEIDCLREAARISDHMLNALFDRLPGYRGPGWKLLVEMEYAGRSLGADIATAWFSYGQPAAYPQTQLEEMQRDIREGDQILTGTYVVYRGYWGGHCLRMASMGEPSENWRRLYEVALKGQQAGAAQLRVGGDSRLVTSEVDRVAEEMIPGISDASQSSGSRHAHFIGLDYAEKGTPEAFPYRSRWQAGTPTPVGVVLRPGMVLELHPGFEQAGVGFAKIGDVYLVTEERPERLTRFPQDLFVAR